MTESNFQSLQELVLDTCSAAKMVWCTELGAKFSFKRLTLAYKISNKKRTLVFKELSI